jgi:hypothetical protein
MKNITRLGLFVALSSAILSACSSLSSGPVGVGGEKVAQQVVIDNGDTVLTSSAVGKPLTVAEKTAMVTAKQVIHVFSNGYKLVAINDGENYRTPAGDILIARAQDLGDKIQKAENDLRKGLGAQGVGLNPAGCSSWFLWSCVYSTSNFIWPDRNIPYVLDGSLSGNNLGRVQNIIYAWNVATTANGNPIKVLFRPKIGNQSFVLIKYSTDTSICGNSFVGNQKYNINGYYTGQTLNIRCLDQDGQLLHELGHAAGLWHEHQRCDRDAFVTVASSDSVAFGKRCGADARDYQKFDYGSVMGYTYGNYSDGSTISTITPVTGTYADIPSNFGTANVLSNGDVNALNTMYN